MTLQDSLNRTEELLRGLRNTNPRPKEVWKAWEAVTNTCGRCEGRCQSLGIPREQRGTAQAIKWQETGDVKYLWDIECPECFGTGRIIRDISDWPEGAVQGLLEFDICRTLGWSILFYPGPQVNIIVNFKLLARADGRTEAAALAFALIAALERITRNE